jgi:hypothetical protein
MANHGLDEKGQEVKNDYKLEGNPWGLNVGVKYQINQLIGVYATYYPSLGRQETIEYKDPVTGVEQRFDYKVPNTANFGMNLNFRITNTYSESGSDYGTLNFMAGLNFAYSGASEVTYSRSQGYNNTSPIFSGSVRSGETLTPTAYIGINFKIGNGKGNKFYESNTSIYSFF